MGWITLPRLIFERGKEEGVEYTAQEMRFLLRIYIFIYLVAFTEEVLNGKLRILCSDSLVIKTTVKVHWLDGLW